MERLQNLEEYKELLLRYKKICRHGYCNNYLAVDSVKRYIQLQRIFYETEDCYLLFYTDEGNYYHLHIHLAMGEHLAIEKKDKPIMVRTIFKEDVKTEALIEVERDFVNLGFELYDKSLQIVAQPLEAKDLLKPKCDKALSFLKRYGIKLIYASEEHLVDILKLREEEPLLKEYHFAYETPDELQDNIRKGYYRCAVNEQGEILAAQQFSVENGTLQGDWLAVKEEYKVKYGIGSAMAYHSFMYAIEHEIPNYYGWVVRDNEKSLKYHESIGYKLTDKYADEWLLM